MEKDRGSRIIAIIALCIAVAGLSLGFAAFSRSLTISSNVEVTPENDFKVDFAQTNQGDHGDGLTNNNVAGVGNPTTLTTTEAEIDNSGTIPKITKLSAIFTQPGQSVTYSFYAHNHSEYKAYLNSIKFLANAKDSEGTNLNVAKKCTPKDDTVNSDYVAAACDDITLSIKVGSADVTSVDVDDIDDHELAIGAYEPIIVTIAYAANGATADGDFSVAFGDIQLKYSTSDDNN